MIQSRKLKGCKVRRVKGVGSGEKLEVSVDTFSLWVAEGLHRRREFEVNRPASPV
jgi:hypothetical protein